MRFKLLMVALLACTNAVPGMAADKNDIRGVIKTVESGGVVALCAPDAVVVDDFGQHLWKGPSACSNWMMALGVYMSAHNMTAPSLKFGEPWQITVDQRAAYVVVPATFGFKVKGKDGTLDGIWTWSLKKTDAGWKINAMAWTARACADVPSCQAAWAPGS